MSEVSHPRGVFTPSERRAVDRIGKRLAAAKTPVAGDLIALAIFEASYVPVLNQVVTTLRNTLGDPLAFDGTELAITSRPMKTIGTIVEKLRRERTRLSTMQDIAGVRIVAQSVLALTQQRRLAERIAEQFVPRARIIDRIARPSYGYRAVHVLPEIDGRRVEVQIRTGPQHIWADHMERLADAWGRGIRYGDPPSGGDPIEIEHRRAAVGQFLHVADLSIMLEQNWDEQWRIMEPLAAAETLSELGSTDVPPGLVNQLKQQLQALDREADETFEELKGEIARFGEMLRQGRSS